MSRETPMTATTRRASWSTATGRTSFTPTPTRLSPISPASPNGGPTSIGCWPTSATGGCRCRSTGRRWRHSSADHLPTMRRRPGCWPSSPSRCRRSATPATSSSRRSGGGSTRPSSRVTPASNGASTPPSSTSRSRRACPRGALSTIATSSTAFRRCHATDTRACSSACSTTSCIDVALGTDFHDLAPEVLAPLTIYTGPIDGYFGHRFGHLPYRSLEFRHETHDRRRFQEVGVVNYPDARVPYTRITEYKHLTGQVHPRTSISYEFARADGDPFYPMPRPENRALYRQYETLARTRSGRDLRGPARHLSVLQHGPGGRPGAGDLPAPRGAAGAEEVGRLWLGPAERRSRHRQPRPVRDRPSHADARGGPGARLPGRARVSRWAAARRSQRGHGPPASTRSRSTPRTRPAFAAFSRSGRPMCCTCMRASAGRRRHLQSWGRAAGVGVVRTEHLPWLITDPGQEADYARAAASVDAFVAVSDAAAATWARALGRLRLRRSARGDSERHRAAARHRTPRRRHPRGPRHRAGGRAAPPLHRPVHGPEGPADLSSRPVRSSTPQGRHGPAGRWSAKGRTGSPARRRLRARRSTASFSSGCATTSATCWPPPTCWCCPRSSRGCRWWFSRRWRSVCRSSRRGSAATVEALGAEHPFLCEAGDPDDLARALAAALDDPASARACAEAQRRRFDSQFTAERMTTRDAAALSLGRAQRLVPEFKGVTRAKAQGRLRRLRGHRAPSPRRPRDLRGRRGGRRSRTRISSAPRRPPRGRARAPSPATTTMLAEIGARRALDLRAALRPRRAGAGGDRARASVLRREAGVAGRGPGAARSTRRCDGAGLVTAVGYHWRYLDTVDEARRLLRDNPAHLMSGYWLDQTPPPEWWRREDRSGGQMVEQATHVIDLARFLAGDVVEVFGMAATRRPGRVPAASTWRPPRPPTLRFASGAIANLSATCLLRWGHRIGLHVFADALAHRADRPRHDGRRRTRPADARRRGRSGLARGSRLRRRGAGRREPDPDALFRGGPDASGRPRRRPLGPHRALRSGWRGCGPTRSRSFRPAAAEDAHVA